MTIFKSVALATLIAGCAMVPAAHAASTVTDLFMASVKANVAFLDQSGKLAASHSKSAAVRAFAKSEIEASIRTASLLDHVAPQTRLADAGTTDTVVTGRSVAIAPPLGEAANGRVAPSPADVDHLRHLDGRRFDDALWLKQIDALSQLRADYETYAASGDDAVLRSVAKAELPRVEARLAALSKI